MVEIKSKRYKCKDCDALAKKNTKGVKGKSINLSEIYCLKHLAKLMPKNTN